MHGPPLASIVTSPFVMGQYAQYFSKTGSAFSTSRHALGLSRASIRAGCSSFTSSCTGAPSVTPPTGLDSAT